MASLATNITQAISDFDDIKEAIEDRLVNVPSGTPTSQYASKIGQIWGTHNLTNFQYFGYTDRFSDGSSLQGLDTSNGTNFEYMFYQCSQLKNVPLFDTSKATTFFRCFGRCYLLEEIPLFDTGNVLRFSDMFGNSAALKTIPLLDMSKGTDFGWMFVNCSGLLSFPAANTSSGTIFSSMFQNCTSLTTIGKIDISNATSVTNMFLNCTSLSNITFEGSIKISGLDVSACPLTITSLRSIITALYDYSGSTAHSIVLGATNIAKLNSTDLATITAKNWTYS